MAAAAMRAVLRRPRVFTPCVQASRSTVRCVAATRAITTATRPHAAEEEFLSKDQFDSMIPKDALKDLDTSVPVIVEGEKNYSDKVVGLADEILALNLLETADLCDILKGRLNLDDDSMFFPMPNMSGMVMAGAPAGEAEAAAEPVEEKTHFDLKLVSFEAKSKIKIIKEVRAATKLGLKEAKDLVESAPAVLLKDASKDDAEPLKAALEELGAHMELE